jgi:hypothetical protein
MDGGSTVKGLVGNLESKDSTSLVCFCMYVLLNGIDVAFILFVA